MIFTKDDVSQFKSVNGVPMQLSDAERQVLADEWNANELLRENEALERARIITIHDDVLRQQLKEQLDSSTNTQISNYVDSQVTDLASARLMFKRILLLIATN